MPYNLSIITVNRNNAKGLQKTMESVCTQTFRDFEYIVVDGASTDNDVDIIKSFDNDCFSSYKWISETDTGVYQAMNKGLKIATGEYVLFLNSGDFLVDNEVLGKIFSKNNSADILCGRCNVSENGKVVWTSNPPENITFGTLLDEGLAHQSTLIKRSLFSEIGLYREDFKYNSDIDFWYRSIIINLASTSILNLVISDYNLDGISSKEHNTDEYKNEIKQILSQSNFEKFLPDYENWRKEKKSMEVYSWVKTKKFLDLIIKTIYKMVVFKQKFKKQN